MLGVELEISIIAGDWFNFIDLIPSKSVSLWVCPQIFRGPEMCPFQRPRFYMGFIYTHACGKALSSGSEKNPMALLDFNLKKPFLPPHVSLYQEKLYVKKNRCSPRPVLTHIRKGTLTIWTEHQRLHRKMNMVVAACYLCHRKCYCLLQSPILFISTFKPSFLKYFYFSITVTVQYYISARCATQ